MATQTRSHCPNCDTKYEPRARVCAFCGRVRDRKTSPEPEACPVTSYSVPLRDGTRVGPVPLATVVQMIKAGTISSDSPVFDMDSGKCFLADEHPLIRVGLGLKVSPPISDTPPSTAPTPSTTPPVIIPESAWVLGIRRCPSCGAERPAREDPCGYCGKPIPDHIVVTSVPAPGQYPSPPSRSPAPSPSAMPENVKIKFTQGFITSVVAFFILLSGIGNCQKREEDARNRKIERQQAEVVRYDESLRQSAAEVAPPAAMPAFTPSYSGGSFRSSGRVHVSGYTRKDGTRVRSYTRRRPSR